VAEPVDAQFLDLIKQLSGILAIGDDVVVNKENTIGQLESTLERFPILQFAQHVFAWPGAVGSTKGCRDAAKLAIPGTPPGRLYEMDW
jgi:hypothetical protein